jgi:hypothetical protein
MVRPRRIPHEDEVRAVVRDEAGASFASRGTTQISNLGGSPTATDVAAKVDEIVNALRASGVIAAGRF